MATDLFLIRKNQTFAKYSQVEGVSLTSSTTYATAGITGNSTTNFLTGTIAAPAAGSLVYFSALTGGTGLLTNQMYYVISPSGNDFKLTKTPEGAEVDFTTPVTAATMTVLADDEIKVWSSEYRDLFATQGSADGSEGMYVIPSGSVAPASISGQFSFPGIGAGQSTLSFTGGTLNPSYNATFTPTVTVMSDEAAHAPLRQTLLKRTHWKFDMGASVTPQYLYASWQDGDTIANNAPDSL